jgi:hypothetical protein
MVSLNLDLEDKRLYVAIVAVGLLVVFTTLFPLHAGVGALGFCVGLYARPKLSPFIQKIIPKSRKDRIIANLKEEIAELKERVKNAKK